MGTIDPRNVKYLSNKAVVLFTSRIVLRQLGEDSKTLYRKVGETATKLIKINAGLKFLNPLDTDI